MTATFDVFTKRNKQFHIGIAITIATAAYIAWGASCNFQFKQPLMGFMEALLVFGSMTSLGFVLFAGLGGMKTFEKEGELVLIEDYVIIDGVKIQLNETNSISFNLGLRTNRRGGYIVSNRIEIIDKNNKTFKNRFVISSNDLDAAFETLLDKWRTNKVAFNLRYHGV